MNAREIKLQHALNTSHLRLLCDIRVHCERVFACVIIRSPGGYYIQMAKNKTNSWQIYFMGGGWCYSKVDCLGRSKTNVSDDTSN